ncbi:MAG: hypothetical protein DRJ03_23835, partial [Chloroflexi bacterium]
MIKSLRVILVLVMLMMLASTMLASALAIQAPFPAIPHRLNVRDTTTTTQAGMASPIIIDHTCTDLSTIPDHWIEQAKDQLRLSYGHTSHG